MTHGYKPCGAPHAKVDTICDSSLLETIGHVPYILLFNVVEVIEAIKPASVLMDARWFGIPKPIQSRH